MGGSWVSAVQPTALVREREDRLRRKRDRLLAVESVRCRLRGKPGAEGEDGGRIGAAAGVRSPLRPTVKNVGLWPLKLRWRQGERSVGWGEMGLLCCCCRWRLFGRLFWWRKMALGEGWSGSSQGDNEEMQRWREKGEDRLRVGRKMEPLPLGYWPRQMSGWEGRRGTRGTVLWWARQRACLVLSGFGFEDEWKWGLAMAGLVPFFVARGGG